MFVDEDALESERGNHVRGTRLGDCWWLTGVRQSMAVIGQMCVSGFIREIQTTWGLQVGDYGTSRPSLGVGSSVTTFGCAASLFYVWADEL